ncbi:hypothetical protein KQI65_15720 [bacterium]|nr:hypothetical protein [bacterium]
MNTFRVFLAGFLTLAMLHVFATCSDDDGGTQPNNPPTVDVEKIHEAAQGIEDAFRTAKTDAVLAVLTEEAQQQYGEGLDDITGDMPAFADAIQSRRLTGYNEFYAEYSYEKDGNTFTIALAAQEEGDWKLMRF